MPSDELLERLRYRWPYSLEDEAQDSVIFNKRYWGCWL